MWFLDNIFFVRENQERRFLERYMMFTVRKSLIPGSHRATDHTKLSMCPNVLTPDRIPEFFIPPKLRSIHADDRDSKEESGTNALNLPKRDVKKQWNFQERYSSNQSATEHDLIRAAHRHVIQIESAELDTGFGSQYAGEEETNKEEEERREKKTYGVQSAISMPQLTQGGLAYLPESPHTRRRESLFHSPHVARKSPTGEHSSSLTLQMPSPEPRLHFAGQSPQYLDSDTTSSAESSPFSSPLLGRSLAGTLVCQAYASRQRLFCRTINAKAVARASSLSTDEASSSDNSPIVPRKLNETRSLSSAPSGATLAPPPLFHLDFICCHERLTKENTILLGGQERGKLRLSAEYIRESARLRVRVVNAEGLYPPSFECKHVSCCVLLHLKPGKTQRQKSTIIKKSRNPIFNEDFFFEGLGEKDLQTRSLRIKVVNKGANMKRDTLLGECELSLCSILPP
ncbi:C2 calcium-dependent domain-containing protein 4C-like [Polypterus senegalus]|uniref:C2 calcium-dependent domain-containing protein 4C-like n=1 Tax=Polypterus senegalus TaxID=55291 RepID=UPI00196485A9|nr:C2 calcium-dependent domain-containing protein 4C-like [Polypterus senegalus]